jgi:hypothetical protein
MQLVANRSLSNVPGGAKTDTLGSAASLSPQGESRLVFFLFSSLLGRMRPQTWSPLAVRHNFGSHLAAGEFELGSASRYICLRRLCKRLRETPCCWMRTTRNFTTRKVCRPPGFRALRPWSPAAWTSTWIGLCPLTRRCTTSRRTSITSTWRGFCCMTRNPWSLFRDASTT